MKRRLMIAVLMAAIPTADAAACGLLAGVRQRVQQRRDARVARTQPAACQSGNAPAVTATHTVDSPSAFTQVAYERLAPVAGLLDSPCAGGRCPKH